MQVDVYVPVALSLLLGLLAAPVGRRLPPAAGTRMLVVSAATAACCWLWALALLAWTAVAQVSFVATQGHWSKGALRAHDPVAGPVAWLAAFLLLAGVAALLGVTVRRVRTVWVFGTAWREVCTTRHAELVVVPDDQPRAFALPLHGGHIVVSTAMLGALNTKERRVLLAHERTHLRRRHHLWMLTAQLAVAADPLLLRLSTTVHYLVERWADEEAARVVGDRRVAARALGRAGLAVLRARSAHEVGPTPAFAASRVRSRVAALVADPAPPRWDLVALVAALTAMAVIGAVAAGMDLEQMFDLAASTSGW